MNTEDSDGILLADFFDDSWRWWLTLNGGRVLLRAAAPDSSLQTPNGFLHFVKSKEGPKEIGYFSLHLDSAGGAPDYARSLVILADDVVFGAEGSGPSVAWRKRLRYRSIEIRDDRGHRTIDYPWSPFIGFIERAVSDPFGYVSRDFVEELVKIVAFYRADWMRKAA